MKVDSSCLSSVLYLCVLGFGLALCYLSTGSHVEANSARVFVTLGTGLFLLGFGKLIEATNRWSGSVPEWVARIAGWAARPAGILAIIGPMTAAILVIVWLPRPSYPPYPLPSGLVAAFSGSKDVAVRTDLRNGFSIFTDNEFNLGSKCWYERIYQGGEEGFLRVHYQLDGEGRGTAFVGLFTGFSPPPCNRYSVEHFSSLHLAVRVSDEHAADVGVVVAVPSANVETLHDEYVWPCWEVPQAMLQDGWSSVRVPFSELRSPERVAPADRQEFDPRQVIQFVLMIRTDADDVREGHIDIDKVQFE